ncbi:LamG-like jellyroll fold domain-containing protein, partial [Candidatus Omnitrophota bacterium]
AGSTVVSPDTWYHVALTYDASNYNFKLYTNGVPDREATLSQPLNLGTGIRIAGDHFNDNYLPGYIDEVAIYDTVLSSDDISALYNNGSGSYITPTANTVGIWHLDDGPGTTATDSTGNGNDGTLINGPTWEAGIVPMTATYNLQSALEVTNDLTINSNATLSAGANDITVAGNWANNAGASGFDCGTGTVTFTGSQTQIIKSGGAPFHNLVIAGTGSGYALQFDGAGDYVNLGDNPDFDFTSGDFAVTAWINPKAYNGSIFAKDDVGQRGYMFAIGSSGTLYYEWNGGTRQLFGSTVIPTDTWHFVVFTYNSAAQTMRSYVDGVIDATLTSVANPYHNTAAATIGRRAYTGAETYFNGTIDEPVVYDHALSEGDIATLYNNNAGTYGTAQSGLVAGWHLDDGGAQTTASDYSQSGTHVGSLLPLPYSTGPVWVTGEKALPVAILQGDLVVTNDLSINNGTLDAGANNYAVTVGGDWTNTGTFKAHEGIVTFDKDALVQILDAGSSAFYNLTHSQGGTLQLSNNDLLVNGAMLNSLGTFDANGRQVTVAALTTISDGVYQASTAVQTFNGGLTIAGGLFNGSTGTVDVNDDVNISSGTLNAPSTTMTVAGNWNKTGGDFDHNGGTITFNGAGNCSIRSGGSAFFNVIFDIQPGIGSGYALQFDGAGDYVNLGDNPDFDFTSGDFAVTAWINPKAYNGSIFAKDDVGQRGYMFAIGSSGTLYYEWNGGTRQLFGSTVIPTDTWHFVVFTYNSAAQTMRSYVDGVIDATLTSVANPYHNTAAATIGRRAYTGAETYFNGTIDEPVVYDHALSEGDIATLYNNNAGTYGTAQSGLVAGWHLDDGGAQTTASDYSQSGTHVGSLLPLPYSTGPVWVTGEKALEPVPGNYTLNDPLAAANDLTINTGILSAGSNTITVGGDWTNNAGASGFDCGTGTVTLAGSGSIKTGGAAFYNLTVDSQAGLDSVAHWLMNDTDGSTAVDSSGNGHDATGTYTPTSGKISGALMFNGSSDYTEVSGWQSTTGNDPFSISAWLKTVKSDSGHSYLLSWGAWDNNTMVNFGLDMDNYPGKLVFFTGNYGSTATIASSVSVNDGNWHYGVATWDGTTMRIYVDGVLSGQQTGTLSIGSGDTGIGTSIPYMDVGGGNGMAWNGSVDDVRIYDTALDISQIAQLYNSGSGTEAELGTYSLDGSLTVANNLNISGGTLSAGTNNITVGGDWTNTNSSAFDAGTGTVTFNGTDQGIYGSTTFNNIEKIVSSATEHTLTFEHGETQIITGDMKLQGYADVDGQRLKLRSDLADSAWLIDPQGTRTIQYLDVKDSTNINASPVIASGTGSKDSLQNIGWSFAFDIALSGKAYSDLAITYVPNLTTIYAAVNGEVKDNTTTNETGDYSFAALTVEMYNSILLYFDDGAVIGNAVAPITSMDNLDLNLYGTYLSVDAVSGATISNADLGEAKGSLTDDILYSVSTNDLTLNANLVISPDITYAPGGNITLSGNWENSGAFDPGLNTVDFNAGTGITQTLDSGGTAAGKTFYDIAHSGEGTLKLLDNSIMLSGDFVNATGTLDFNNLAIEATGLFDSTTGVLAASSGGLGIEAGTIDIDSISIDGLITLLSYGDIGIAGSVTSNTREVYISVNAISGDGSINIGGGVTSGTDREMRLYAGSQTGNDLTVTGNINAGGTLKLAAWRNITTADIIAGSIDMTYAATNSDPPDNVTLGEVSTTGDIDILALVDITTGNIASADGYVNIEAGQDISTGTISAGTDIQLISYRNASFGNISAPLGAVEVYASQGPSGTIEAQQIDAAAHIYLGGPADTIYLNGNLSTTEGYAVILDGPVILKNNIGISTGASVAGDISFNNTVDSDATTRNLLLEAGTGNIYFGGAVGAGDLGDGLVSQWTMNDTSGSIIDSIGGNNGAYNGSLYSQSGKINTSIGFDGTDDYVSVPVELRNSLDNNDFSVSVWFKAVDTGLGSMFSEGDAMSGAGNDNQGIRFFFSDSNGIYARVRGDNNSVGQYAPEHTSLGVWYSAVLVRDYGSTVKLYVNGTEAWSLGDNAGAMSVTKGPWIGAESNNLSMPDGMWFDGMIDEVRVYDTALTPTEILALYNNGSGTESTDSLALGDITISSAANVNIAATVNATGVASVTADNTNFNTGASWTLQNDLDITGNLVLNAGTLDASDQQIDITGTWARNNGTFTAGTGTVVFNGTSAISGSNITQFGNLAIANGATLTAHPTEIRVSGNWTNLGGAFAGGSGTVIFNGAGESLISGDTTFANFTCTEAGKTVRFAAGSTQTMTGLLYIEGASGNLINLLSDSSPSVWYIDPQGTRNVSYIEVHDSENIHTQSVDPIHSLGEEVSYNNTNWFGVYQYVVSGTVYSDEYAGGLVGEGKTVSMILRGVKTSTLTLADSTYSFTDVNYYPKEYLLVYIDDDATYDANAFTITTNQSLADFHLYADMVVASYETNGPLTNATFATAYQDDAGDIIFSVTGSDLDVNGGLRIDSGKTFSPGGNITLEGSFINMGTFTPGSYLVEFDGSSTGKTISTAQFNNLTFTGSGEWTIDSALTVGVNLNIANATVNQDAALTVNGYYNQTSGSFNSANVDLVVKGNFDVAGTFNKPLGKLILSGTGTQNLSAPTAVIGDLYHTGSGTVQVIGDLTVDGDFYNEAGTFKTGTGTITLGDDPADSVVISGGVIQIQSTDPDTQIVKNASTWTNSAGTVNYCSASTVSTSLLSGVASYNNLTINSSGSTYAMPSSLQVAGNVNIASGTLDANSYDIEVGGNWTKSGGFTATTGTTVTFVDAAKSSIISGNTSFYNLTCTTKGKDLYFASGSTQTVNNALTIAGDSGAGELVTLDRSGGTDPAQWNINVVGSASVVYAWVQDSNASGGIEIQANNSANAGNNDNWQFGLPQLIISGNVYSDLGENLIGEGVTIILALQKGGAPETFTTQTTPESYYEFTGITAPADTVMLAYIDGHAVNGAIVSIAAGEFGDPAIRDFHIYGDCLVVRNEGASSVTNSTLTDALYSITDDDIPYVMNATTLDLPGSLDIWTDSTYAPAGNIEIAGSLINEGTYTSGANLVTFDGSGSIASNSSHFNNLVFENASGSWTLEDNLYADGYLYINSGTLDVNGKSVTVVGDFVDSSTSITCTSGNIAISAASISTGAITNNASGGAITLTATSGSISINEDISSTNGNITFNGPITFTKELAVSSGNGYINISDQVLSDYALTLSGNVKLNSGASWTLSQPLTVGGFILNSGSTFNANEKDMIVTGSWTNSGGAFDYGTNGNTIHFAGGGTQNISAATQPFYNAVHSGTGTAKLQQEMTVNGYLTNSAGIFDTNDKVITVNGLTTISGGEYKAGQTVTQTLAGGLLITDGTFTGSSGEVDIQGDVTLEGGTMVAPAGELTIPSDWVNTGGTFVPGQSTVVFSGTDSNFDDNTSTFNNIRIEGTMSLTSSFTVTGDFIVAPSSHLTQGAGSNITVDGDARVSFANGTFTKDPTGAGELRLYGTIDFEMGDNAFGAIVVGHSPYTITLTQGDDTLTDTLVTDSLVINPGDTLVTSGFDIVINEFMVIGAGGVLDASDAEGRATDITFQGSLWENDNPITFNSYIHGNSTVIFEGSNQSISGSTTFRYFSKIVT